MTSKKQHSKGRQPMPRSAFAVILLTAALGSAAVVDAVAGENVIASLARSKLNQSPAIPKSPPLPQQHLYLIRSTLAALSDANRSGNYSVLRDLAAPAFQARHSAADLAHIFTDVRTRPVDLSTAITIEPKVTETARPDATSLRLSGYIPAEPNPILFAMQFDAVAGHWRLASISIGLQPNSPTDRDPKQKS